MELCPSKDCGQASVDLGGPRRQIDLPLVSMVPLWLMVDEQLQGTQTISFRDGDGSKPWYLVNPKIAGKWMFIPLKCIYRYWPIPRCMKVSGKPFKVESTNGLSQSSLACINQQGLLKTESLGPQPLAHLNGALGSGVTTIAAPARIHGMSSFPKRIYIYIIRDIMYYAYVQ